MGLRSMAWWPVREKSTTSAAHLRVSVRRKLKPTPLKRLWNIWSHCPLHSFCMPSKSSWGRLDKQRKLICQMNGVRWLMRSRGIWPMLPTWYRLWRWLTVLCYNGTFLSLPLLTCLFPSCSWLMTYLETLYKNYPILGNPDHSWTFP